MVCDCIACELLTEVNELGFCEACFEKFERDLIQLRNGTVAIVSLNHPYRCLQRCRLWGCRIVIFLRVLGHG